jgi:hypothetical protein
LRLAKVANGTAKKTRLVSEQIADGEKSSHFSYALRYNAVIVCI